ncbi:MAG: restriction endonuclease subunit S [Gammaproteobacteria bacterium]|nr:restriction endonuclease subunit S [Gammaproteobacteria bacterium]
MTEQLHLSAKHRRSLESLLREHLPHVEVWAYGSRVTGRSHDGSDLDLVLRGPELKEIPYGQIADFEDAVRESRIPFLVEARDWARLPERFHREIEREYLVLRKGHWLKMLRHNEGITTSFYRNNWQRLRWDDLVTLQYGRSLQGYETSEKKYRVFGTNGPIGSHSEPLCEHAGVIVGRKGAYRGVHYSPDPFYVIDTAFYLKPKVTFDMRWAYYVLLTQDINGMDSGSAIPSTSREEFYALPVDVPSLDEQRTIAHILGTLDDKIELKRRMNETLEATVHAIFKDWFVDFGPTRAKAEGRAPYLPPELWELFPDALDDEGKPAGWERGTLADIAESPKRNIMPADVANDTPYIGLEHMPRRLLALSEWNDAGKVTSAKSQFYEGEILFGKLRPYFHKVGIAPINGICSTDIVVVIPRTQEWGAFTLGCLSSDEFVDYTSRTSTGTKMPRTRWGTMEQYAVYLPPKQVIRAHQSVVRPLFDRLSSNVREMSTVAQTRDVLLPKLISGEVDVWIDSSVTTADVASLPCDGVVS